MVRSGWAIRGAPRNPSIRLFGERQCLLSQGTQGIQPSCHRSAAGDESMLADGRPESILPDQALTPSNATWLRPLRLARYIDWSARESSDERLSRPG